MVNRTFLTAYTTALALVGAIGGSVHAAPPAHGEDPIALADLGSFSFGGKVVTNEAGQTLHCDHGYAQYYIPRNARQYPLVMWHSSSVRTWETTPDGRDGFQKIFLHRDFPVYTFDPPRIGRAAQACAEMTYTPVIGRDQSSFSGYGFGVWNPPDPPMFHPHVQVAKTPEFIDQFFRARYPENPEVGEVEGQEGDGIEVPAVVALLEKIGPAILLTHSGSGSRGWLTATKSLRVKGIVAYDPIAFTFPKDEAPPSVSPMPGGLTGRITAPILVSQEEFENLTRVKIQIVFGETALVSTSDLQRVVRQRAEQFIDAVNRHGGDAQILYLPEAGLFGNTHFAMQDLNNVEVANLLSSYLMEEGLDRR